MCTERYMCGDLVLWHVLWTCAVDLCSAYGALDLWYCAFVCICCQLLGTHACTQWRS